jgi:hypothetical protein
MTDDMTHIIRKLNRSGQTHTVFEAFKRMHGRYPGLREGAVFAARMNWNAYAAASRHPHLADSVLPLSLTPSH